MRHVGFGSSTEKGGVDDEGSTISDITMYHADDEGTCQCEHTSNYCVNSSEHSEFKDKDMCCVAGVNATFEGYQNRLIANALEGYRDTVGGGAAVPSTAAVDAAFYIAGGCRAREPLVVQQWATRERRFQM